MRIKVLHIIKSLGRGGAEMLLPETLALHDTEKFEFHYIYFLPWKDQMVQPIEALGGTVTCLSANNNIRIMMRLKEVANYIKDNNIQLVHAHLPWAGFLSRIIYRMVSIPVLYTEHNKQERYHRITFLLNKLTFNWQSQVIAVSGDVEDSIKHNISTKTQITTILNGVNTDKFVRQPSLGEKIRRENSIPPDALVVGTVAVFRFQKRLKEWMYIFKKAYEVNPNLYGVIVGDGPLREELLEERKLLGLEERIIMPGLQTNTPEWYSAMDIFMMSSVFEGLPIALLEAMSMKCAVVTTNAGGIKEVIEPGKSGLMVAVDKWQELAGHLEKLSDSSYRDLLAEGARQRVEKGFSLKEMVNQLEALYINYGRSIK